MEIPDDPLNPRRVFVAMRRSSPFTSTEAARVGALLQVAAAADRSRTEASGSMVTDVHISPLAFADLDDVEALHRRCSSESRYRRHLSAMPTIRRDDIAGLLEAEHGRIARAAWIGDRLVGMGAPRRSRGSDRPGP